MNEETYRAYCSNRTLHPQIPAECWAEMYANVPEMEERYIKDFIKRLFEVTAEDSDA